MTGLPDWRGVRIEIVNTGAELMLGEVLNSHQQWICRELATRGYVVARQVAVDDSGPAIQQAVREAVERANLVLVTGGLGPTSDDRTRDLIAQLFDRKLREDVSVLDHVQRFFAIRNRSMPANARVQALVPEGATVLMNAHGTAPGLVMPLSGNKEGERLLIMLPGPPRELRPMFLDQVVPLIQTQFPIAESFVCRTLRTTGLGESWVEEKIHKPLKPLTDAGLELGYCARNGEVDVRFVAHGGEAASLVAQAEGITRAVLGEIIFGIDDDTLEAVVVRRLAERKQTVALAESCTGGLIAHRLTNVPGASAVFVGGLVAYSNELKQTLLAVTASSLDTHGAVSESVARGMAEGARARLRADYALSVTGIAGPSGGSETKPVGTVYLGLASASKTIVLKQFNPYDREMFKQVTSQQALNLLRRKLESD
jgi:nicotinamide-nucleotide amidase